MSDPRATPFWNAERDHLWNAVSELAMRSLAAGTAGGEALLPEPVRQLIAWDVLNQAAIDYLRLYRLNTITGISNTTAKQAISTIEAWMEAGEPLPILQARMESVITDGRAKTIATTEVTRIYAEGNQLAWQSAGVVAGNRWNTANDERVCPLCAPLHNKVVSLRTYFDETDTQGLSNVSWSGVAPPRHPNCRCWLSPIVTEESLERELERQLARVPR